MHFYKKQVFQQFFVNIIFAASLDFKINRHIIIRSLIELIKKTGKLTYRENFCRRGEVYRKQH